MLMLFFYGGRASAITAQDAQKGPALVAAVKNGDLKAVRALLKQAPDLANYVDKNGFPILMTADSDNQLEIARLLISHGADLEARDRMKGTILMKAALFNYPRILKLLIEKGANIHPKIMGCLAAPPLFLAARGGCLENVKILLSLGLDPNQRDHCSRGTPLMEAAEYGHTKVAALLISKGADVNAKDEDGDTALLIAASKNNTALVELLLEHGADLKAPDKSGLTPLISAVDRGAIDTVKLLLKRGADIHARSHYINPGEPILCGAAQDGSVAMMRFLISKGADIRGKDDYGNTPLFWAALLGHADVVEYLLNNGLPVDPRNKKMRMDLFITSYVEGRSWYNLTENQDGLVFKNCTLGGYTPLAAACVRGHEKVMAMLIAAGADINTLDNQGDTPLIIAAQHGCIKAVKLLLSKGAAVNTANKAGNTALIVAAGNSHADVVRTLIRHKAEVNIKNVRGQTAIALTSKKPIRRMLEAAGAKS